MGKGENLIKAYLNGDLEKYTDSVKRPIYFDEAEAIMTAIEAVNRELLGKGE